MRAVCLFVLLTGGFHIHRFCTARALWNGSADDDSAFQGGGMTREGEAGGKKELPG